MITAQDYKDAILIQDAVNLVSITKKMYEAASKIYKEQALKGEQSTEALWGHPLMVLYASKIASLTGCEHYTTFSAAYERALLLSEDR